MASVDDICASCTLLFLSSIAFFAYVLVLCAIYKVYKTTKNAFYMLLFALGVSDTIMLALFLFYSTTATFIQRPPLGSEFDALFGGALCNVTYFTSLALLVNIAVNRYYAICSKVTAVKIYNLKTIRATIVVCYAFGFVSAIAQLTPCCYLRYYEKDYTWSYDMTLDGNANFVWYDRFSNLLTFVCLVSTYGLIYKKLKNVKRVCPPSTASTATANAHHRQSLASTGETNPRRKSDIHLAIQSALVSTLIIVFGLGFTIIPMVATSKWWNLLSSILYLAAVGVHPFVYVACNGQIRARVFGFIRCSKNDNHSNISTGAAVMRSSAMKR